MFLFGKKSNNASYDWHSNYSGKNMTTLEILKIVLEAMAKAGAGEMAKGTVELGKKLWQKIRERLSGKPVATAALVEAEKSQSEEPLAKVVPFLEVAMLEDEQFANEVKNIAQQIKQEINAGNQTNIQINANAYHQSTQKVVGEIKADTVNF